MAIAVPLLLSATGASAAIGAAIGVSAAVVTAGAGLLVGATGIGKSINKAASKVFGEDLVKVANIAGAIYMAVDGFSGSEGGASTDVSSANAVNGMDAASDAASAAAGGGQAGYGALDAAGNATQLAGADAANAAAKFTSSAAKAATPDLLSTTAKYLGNPKVQGSLISAGGEMLARKQEIDAQEEALEKQRAWQQEDQKTFKSGSGLKTYYTRRPVFPAATGG